MKSTGHFYGRRYLFLIVILASLCGLTGWAQEETASAMSVNTAAAEAAVDASMDDDFDDEYATMVVDVYDPFESYNRAMFAFNDKLYTYTLRPIARGYEWLVPEAPRRGISNFFENLGFPLRLVANILQFKFKQAGREVGKFVLNTTVGVGGFFKVSEKVSWLRDTEPLADFGQVLGTWGMKKGPFIVLPVLGPMTARDGVGRVGAYYMWPGTWQYTKDHVGRGTITAADALYMVNSFPGLLKVYDMAVKGAVDPYIAMRNGYVQYREAMIKNPPKSTPHVPPPLKKGKPRSR